ncbi:MAG: leucine-rich repeat protein [Lachnospiraceae bacterium]|nr:leucine-rich repeat protein [Lachnospiraceae bacterium]
MMNAVKKKSRRLKKSVRRTLGTLFLISALLVAAIPVDGLRAAEVGGIPQETAEDTAPDISVDIFQYVPRVSPSATIYTTGDGKFQFAYVSRTTGTQAGENLEIVILGYQKAGELAGGLLTIPNTVDAYLKYSSSDGNYGFAAVNKRGEFLYYRVYDDAQYERDENGVFRLDENGNRILKPDAKPEYRRCTYESSSFWKNLNVENDFYYYKDNVVTEGIDPQSAINEPERPILNAPVHYIGSQYLTPGTGNDIDTWKIEGNPDDESSWSIVQNSEQGVFYGVGNIQTLVIGGDLMGIGDHAFDSCTLMSSITLNNGLEAIGNYAFANCINMKTANIAVGASVRTIGEHAFYNCQGLESFNMPVAVQEIGDSAFENCQAMLNIYLNGESGTEGNYNVLLSKLGKNVFKGCSVLEKITFPQNFNNAGEGVDVSVFQGCSALQYIETTNSMFDLKAEKGFSIEAFKNTVQREFYLRGLKDQPLHITATNNQIPYSFWDDELNINVYELTLKEDNDPNKLVVYRVDENDQMVYFEQKNPLSTPSVTLPSAIGPRKVASIGSTAFQDKCFLEKVTIPESVGHIAANAFKGCHKLSNVIFVNPPEGMTIDSGAFKTQDVGTHSCSITELPKTPVLNFVGPISYDAAPFIYAMDPKERINVGTQDETYIRYQSGWPANLEVQYNPATGKNTLVNYPTFTELKNGGRYTSGNYAYITPEYEAAAQNAALKYAGEYSGGDTSLTDDEQNVLNSVFHIVLPEGIEAIGTMEGQGLFEYKEGLVEIPGDTVAAKMRKTLTAEGLEEVEANAFKGSRYTTQIILGGETVSIGDHAFDGCKMLSEVSIPATVSQLGISPFRGCDILADVNFNGGPYFTCDQSIIYEIDEERNHTKLVEYLSGRALPLVQAHELEGITEIYPEAFMGTNVVSVDLSGTEIKSVPENLFRNTQSLTAVTLPDTCTQIKDNAFSDSSIFQVVIPSSVNAISSIAFGGSTNKSNLVIVGELGSPAHDYADVNGIKFQEGAFEGKHTVTFYDDSTPPRVLKVQIVSDGQAATPPTQEEIELEDFVFEREGYTWSWKSEGNYLAVFNDVDVYLYYEEVTMYTVTFMDYDNKTLLGVDRVAEGADAVPPEVPEREGYTFIGWRPAITNVRSDMTVVAQYEQILLQHTVTFLDDDGTFLFTQVVDHGKDATAPRTPVKEGYTFVEWRPYPINVTEDMTVVARYRENSSNVSPSPSPSPTPTPGTGSGNSGSDNSVTRLYTLTVRNGSGSGSYAPGNQIIVVADNPASSQEFSGWTVSPANTVVTDKTLSAIVVTMPANDVALVANYKNKETSPNTGNTGNTGSGNTSDTHRPSGGTETTTNNGGTTVVIDKNGLSNTGVVSVTINGSSDSFTVKVSESTEATEAVLRALMAEYGSVDKIKYFPMDISLYDSTGTRKITDTTGLKISITLPLPDSLAEYVGNNKVAGVVNGTLDKLTPRFITINGVPCVTFNAEHFSPYVIYVDLGNMTSANVIDSSPKTGDGIHPKWFLSIALACLSFIMFMQKDSRNSKTGKKQKVKVRAR